ncbi:hypothetical protein N7539_004609 [Penicillium diatomitis]|uniref:Uncharacterized protein n=1 Tax=Penicillium diatomitis TaxID=2819901 RepID=A0A9X0BYM6_9EURO|nr:uncharacterized protein N7539_004609 [Penicillium diatomitis]KAJ5489719.1 hypothetical protein N7539_004609 [Penicillium diatomitis]
MAGHVKKEEATPQQNSTLILQGEANFSSWLHSLLCHISPAKLKILMEDEPRHDMFPYDPPLHHTLQDTDSIAHDPILSRQNTTKPVASLIHMLDETRSKEREEAFSALWATLGDEAKDLIRNTSSPCRAFTKLHLFYSKPRHFSVAARWAAWTSVHYTAGLSPGEFLRCFGKNLRELEDINGEIDAKIVFAQFMRAVANNGPISDFLIRMEIDLDDPKLMEQVCSAFVRQAMKVSPSWAPPAKPKFCYRGGGKKGPREGSVYCPFHKRMVTHSPSECRLGQRSAHGSANDTVQARGRQSNRLCRKRPRGESFAPSQGSNFKNHTSKRK